MVCWIVPLIATVIAFVGRKVSRRKDAQSFWLNIMLLGGTLFGAIDHLWNGGLFLIGTNWLMDMALGCTITLGIATGWGVIVFKPKISDSMHHLSYRLGILKK